MYAPSIAFMWGENTLVIHPDECIDCGVCEPECPAEAIFSDTDEQAEQWLEMNREFSEIWPNISEKRDPFPNADEMNGVEGKFEKYFSKQPGEGN